MSAKNYCTAENGGIAGGWPGLARLSAQPHGHGERTVRRRGTKTADSFRDGFSTPHMYRIVPWRGIVALLESNGS